MKETLQVGTSSKRFELGPMDYTSTAGKSKGQVVKRFGLQEVVPESYEGDVVKTWKAKFQGERIQVASPDELEALLRSALEALERRKKRPVNNVDSPLRSRSSLQQ